MRIGIIGTGRIASRFADTAFAGIESAYVSCVYNPKAERKEKLWKSFHGGSKNNISY